MTRVMSKFGVSCGESVKITHTISDRSNRKDTKKRRNRSVAALSTDQLARKRAHDRVAQRTIRQRTKEHIETLERKLRELSEGHHSDKELEKERHRNSELETELMYLKESLALSGRDISPLNVAYLTSTNMSDLSQRSSSMPNATLYPSSNSSETSTRLMGTSFPSPASDIACSSPIHQTLICGSPATDSLGCNSLSVGFRDRVTTDVAIPIIPTATCWIENEAIDPLQHVQRISLFPRGDLDSNSSPNRMTEFEPSSSFVNQLPQQAWAIPLRLVPPTGPFDSILIGLIQRQGNLATSGADKTAIIGPYQPSMKTLLYTDNSNSKSHPISTMISNVLHKTALRDVSEKAAVLYLMYRLAQWQISPSSTTYNALPEWQTPRVTQLITPHPAWVSQIVWGKLRDKVIENQELYATEEFHYLYMHSLNVNWPHRGVDAFLCRGEEVTATEAFESHVRTLANWSLDEPFARRYPELRESCRFTEYASYDLGYVRRV